MFDISTTGRIEALPRWISTVQRFMNNINNIKNHNNNNNNNYNNNAIVHGNIQMGELRLRPWRAIYT